MKLHIGLRVNIMMKQWALEADLISNDVTMSSATFRVFYPLTVLSYFSF